MFRPLSAGVCRGARHYLLALQFFTRIPVTGRLALWVGYSPEMLRASSAHFPGVGWRYGPAPGPAWRRRLSAPPPRPM